MIPKELLAASLIYLVDDHLNNEASAKFCFRSLLEYFMFPKDMNIRYRSSAVNVCLLASHFFFCPQFVHFKDILHILQSWSDTRTGLKLSEQAANVKRKSLIEEI